VLALLPYSVAHLGWVLASIVPYVAVMRAIVGHRARRSNGFPLVRPR